ncbi:hypothetical protein BC829DRAFT_29006 [Chytridium lagenaria]|nr:hypothetical protein BC829DRAFT_29006 [Chytridium lagenaria]
MGKQRSNELYSTAAGPASTKIKRSSSIIVPYSPVSKEDIRLPIQPQGLALKPSKGQRGFKSEETLKRRPMSMVLTSKRMSLGYPLDVETSEVSSAWDAKQRGQAGGSSGNLSTDRKKRWIESLRAFTQKLKGTVKGLNTSDEDVSRNQNKRKSHMPVEYNDAAVSAVDDKSAVKGSSKVDGIH